ncbi:MAG: protein kinase [Polyangiaceae bacterium]
MIGEIFGNYRVTAKLGEGGMGAVYLAEHPNIGRKVAIKMIRPVFSNDSETLRRFVREARSTAMLRHPALVDIMDYGVHEKTGSAYILMEYLEGESLDARLEREGKLRPAHAADIARQIALGMAAAHRAGIIHRDLKPGNVHLVKDVDRPGVDVVKVLDFGIAKLANHDTNAGPTTRSDVLLGTPRYMAPEQCRGGGHLDHRADIYSLGCLLYEALAGRPPFAYQWPGELIAAHISEAPTPVRAFDPTIPPAIEAIIMRAIAKNPDQRQPTMGDIARELEQFLNLSPRVDTPAPPHDVSFPAIALQQSGPPPAHHDVHPQGMTAPMTHVTPGAAETPGGVHPMTPAPRATTTASVVMRQGPNLSQRTTRRILVGGAGLTVAGVVLALVIAGRSPSHDTVAENEPATPSAAPSAAARIAATAGPVETTQPRPADPTPVAAAQPVEPTAPATEPKAEIAAPNDEPENAPAPPQGATEASPVRGPATSETIANVVRIRVANPRPGLKVTVDGRSTSLPVRLPRDHKPHVLAFTTPNFKIETKSVVADQDHTLTLDYRPKLYVP